MIFFVCDSLLREIHSSDKSLHQSSISAEFATDYEPGFCTVKPKNPINNEFVFWLSQDMLNQKEEVIAKIITVKTIKKKLRNPADNKNKKNYETNIVMKNNVKMCKLINDNYWKWIKSMRMNLLNKSIWKIINKNVFRFIKSKNKILWTYDNFAAMSYITKNLNDE